jgi:hypothetical protein
MLVADLLDARLRREVALPVGVVVGAADPVADGGAGPVPDPPVEQTAAILVLAGALAGQQPPDGAGGLKVEFTGPLPAVSQSSAAATSPGEPTMLPPGWTTRIRLPSGYGAQVPRRVRAEVVGKPRRLWESLMVASSLASSRRLGTTDRIPQPNRALRTGPARDVVVPTTGRVDGVHSRRLPAFLRHHTVNGGTHRIKHPGSTGHRGGLPG